MNSEARIQELEAKVNELTAMVERMAPALRGAATADTRPQIDVTAVDVVETPTSSRRGMLKLAGAAAVGTVAATMVGVGQAAATNGINITDPALAVRNDYTGNAAQAAFLFQAGSQFTNGVAAFDCALAGWSGAGGSNLPHGVYGFTNNGGFGLVGSGAAGSSGLLVRGERSNMEIRSEGTAAPLRTTAHALGEIINDSTGALWVNVAAGTPGTWRKLAGPSTSGSFHALSPGRVYDSRSALPFQGAIIGGNNRTITVADKRDTTTGAVTTADFVPVGATAVAANITVVSLSGGGFLTVNPGGVTTVGASTINWSAPGQVLANGVTLALNNDRQLTIVAGGGGSTEFIVDIMGYYL